jgi:hypothetical protein
MAEIRIARKRRPRAAHGSVPMVKQAGSFTKRRGFVAGGCGATSMEPVAHCAGVSTKTLYRLFPNNAALYEGTMSDRLERLLSGAPCEPRITQTSRRHCVRR